MTKSDCSWTLFPWENLSRDPKFKHFFHTRVHTLTLNTVTEYKVYTYIQTSLNQIFEISSVMQKWSNGWKNDEVSTFENPFCP